MLTHHLCDGAPVDMLQQYACLEPKKVCYPLEASRGQSAKVKSLATGLRLLHRTERPLAS